jgi:hypothetical protein
MVVTMTTRQRVRARFVLVATVVVVGVVPLVLDRDSFPLSTYPMFSRPRSTTDSVDTAVAVDATGNRVWRLPPQRIAGTDEIILAAAAVSRAISRDETERLCTEIAASVGRDGPSGAAAVEVVTERFDSVRWFEGDHAPVSRSIHARCAVP